MKNTRIQVFCAGDEYARLDELGKVKHGNGAMAVELKDGSVYYFPYRNLVEVRVFEDDADE